MKQKISVWLDGKEIAAANRKARKAKETRSAFIGRLIIEA